MRLLFKIGSALISRDNRIDYFWLAEKVKEFAQLKEAGHELIIVSSGSVAAGMEISGLDTRPHDTLKLQLLSGIGQVKLIKYYKDLFKLKGIYIAQVLLTHHNFDTDREEETILQILNRFLEDGIIPIINENDLVNKEELDESRIFTDNDILAALVARKLEVDTAVLLTNVDGLYSSDPDHPESTLISEVEKIDEDIYAMVGDGKSVLGTGGMQSKVKAADMITTAGIDTIVANGNYPLNDILNGNVPRTRFLGNKV
jgi:glutamate 5-kinase